MPESPTQVDIGRNLYYYHCMPCHGDRGQGLTDEWREVWDEDHRNCWGRGCHSGRAGEEGFPIPHFVPAVSGSPQAIAGFETENSLFEYLLQAHPPQRPGALVEEECWALTAFLLHENGRLAEDDRIGSRTTEPFWLAVGVISGVVLVFLLLAFLILWQKARLARRT
jgi:cytochrome c